MLDPATGFISLGGLTVTVERGFALWRGVKQKGVSARELTEAMDDVKGDVRDALATAQLQGGLERRDLEKAILAALDDLRQELTGVIRERRR